MIVMISVGSIDGPKFGLVVGWTLRVGSTPFARAWSMRALAVLERFDHTADKRLTPRRALLHDIADADAVAAVCSSPVGCNARQCGKRAVKSRNGWCTPPEPQAWQVPAPDPLVARVPPSAVAKTAKGEAEEIAALGKSATRRGGSGSEATGGQVGGQSTLSVWLRASHEVDAGGALGHTPSQRFQCNRTSLLPFAADLGQQPLSSDPLNHKRSAPPPVLVQRSEANASVVLLEPPPFLTGKGTELHGERLAWSGGGLRAREWEGRVRAFAVAEMVGGEGWGRKGDEMGISGRWAALMQAFGLLHSRHRFKRRKSQAVSQVSAAGASSASRTMAVKWVAAAQEPGQHAGKREREAPGDGPRSSGNDGQLKKPALYGIALKWQGGVRRGEGRASMSWEKREYESGEEPGGSRLASDDLLAPSIAAAPPREMIAEIAEGRQKTMDFFALQRL